ncbi:hypothetical protein C497_05352 [Halalkalicoccus jeotgali B3]|uniref:Uncharacterized protein n=1 Tax=Halalkalicoccus jeotgali (strain DSM 18796 / CECT 7217 / JCM 14584 / KCTC 4019 / B3) TaxID=795797 RepID=D8JAQ4_HALJB|nr:hypothetical protein HacjB3_06945 [Halalkalicoccus jeotgali B3]ELY39358.1 hypothetical protein C497_05352 [Halalkalicoccus jeotgali B3]
MISSAAERIESLPCGGITPESDRWDVEHSGEARGQASP